MKSIILYSSMLLYSLTASAQMNKITDSLLTEICKTLNENKGLNDTVRLKEVSDKHLAPVLNLVEPSKQTYAFDFIHYRLQRNCKEYKDILDRMNPSKGDWEKIDTKPVSLLKRKTCQDFLSRENYRYVESNGDTVHVTLKKGIWTDRFPDGTYSQLKFRWVNDCEYEIEYLESNNTVRKNFSMPGDKYRYVLIEENEHFYKISAEIVGTGQFMLFHLYF